MPLACLALYAGSALALRFSHLGAHWPFVDLGVYRAGGRAVLDGRDLYAMRLPGALAFTYTPFAALLFVAIAPLRMALLQPLTLALNLLLLPLAFALALRLAPARSWMTRRQALAAALAASALALWLEPAWSVLRYGQLDLLIVAMVLFDLGRRPHSRWQGAGIGLAAAVKLTPAIFVLYLLLTRRVRAALVALATFAATVAAGFALLPGASGAFWGGAFLDPGRVGRVENAANQSLRGALARMLHTTDVQALWLPVALAVALAGVALAVRAARRGDEALGYSLCALTGLLISPVSWSHHWAIALPALLLLAARCLRRGGRAGLPAPVLAAGLAVAHVIWLVPINHPRHSELRLEPLQLLAADAYVLLALAALALAGRSALLSSYGWQRRGIWTRRQRAPELT